MYFELDNILFPLPKGYSKLNKNIVNSFSENENGEFIKGYFSEILNGFFSENNNTIFFKKISNDKDIKTFSNVLIHHIKSKLGTDNFKISFNRINEIDYLIIKFDQNLMTSTHYYFVYKKYTYVFDLRSLKENFDDEIKHLKNIISKVTFN